MEIDKWGRAMLAHMRLLHPVDVSRNSFSVLVSMREESQYVFAINELSILRLSLGLCWLVCCKGEYVCVYTECVHGSRLKGTH